MIFRELNAKERRVFERYALQHDPDLAQWELYHPVCRAAWLRRGFKPTDKENARDEA